MGKERGRLHAAGAATDQQPKLRSTGRARRCHVLGASCECSLAGPALRLVRLEASFAGLLAPVVEPEPPLFQGVPPRLGQDAEDVLLRGVSVERDDFSLRSAKLPLHDQLQCRQTQGQPYSQHLPQWVFTLRLTGRRPLRADLLRFLGVVEMRLLARTVAIGPPASTTGKHCVYTKVLRRFININKLEQRIFR